MGEFGVKQKKGGGRVFYPKKWEGKGKKNRIWSRLNNRVPQKKGWIISNGRKKKGES